MHDPEQTRERVLMFQRHRELAGERLEQETANQRRRGKLLEEKLQAAIKRILASRMPDTSRKA